MYLALEGGLLAGQLLGVVLLREGHDDILLVACLGADELILKARDKGARAQLELVVLALAALEGRAVYKALKVDADGVVLLGCALDGLGTRQALCHAVKLCLDISCQDLCFFLLDRQALVLAQRDFRLYRDLADQDDRTCVRHVRDIDISRGNCLDIGLLDGLFIGLGIADVQRIFEENAIAIQVLDDLAGRMTFAEARYGDTVAALLVCLLLGSFQFVRRNLNGQSDNALFQLFNIFQFHYNLFLLKLYPIYSIRLQAKFPAHFFTFLAILA